MAQVLFRPTNTPSAPPPPPPSYDTTVNFQISTRPPADFDLGLIKMNPAALPDFDSLEIYSKDAGGNVIGLWCSCYGVPSTTGIGTRCSGEANAQNGASYEVRFIKSGSVVHTATAIITQLYSETVTVDFYFPSEQTDWNFAAKVGSNNWPAGCSGMLVSVVPGMPGADDCFAISAADMASGQIFDIDLIQDPTFNQDFALEAYDGPSAIYRCNCNLIVHES